ncbi:dTDP-4-amino-4,6-dideoxyglucose formyltransferase [Shewanella sp. SNU WT4]|uniref:dTDP-4-amino-4,6-dideoxyglucose formyltransferase n=1 Tax=Shewanella sp. SNU WT4 TaxID=2590015 RepID=UPI00112D779F|nr:dTDP-4-amino-4,6-dideoxyglucose formyltransferase [Shewanella sp. SNU WT4]QDF67644.1 dTDP-4-amino-4,6-dideoxyglucose formyltransferase [Shewanella sp. SNU WT4]
MKKILIVSDNPKLTSFIKQIIIPGINDIECDFCYSKINKTPFLMQELGAEEIDIKSKDVDFARRYDVIFSLHCKQIFPAEIVNNTVCVNVHPGLNPYNRGWFPQVFSIINKLPIGATIHLMNEDVDAGDIIIQKQTFIADFDTSLEVYEKVQNIELELLSEWFERIVLGDYETFSPKEVGNYNSINDFNELCNLNLEHVGTLKEHIELLRALSHGDFKNAYFVDADEIKRYIKVDIM